MHLGELVDSPIDVITVARYLASSQGEDDSALMFNEVQGLRLSDLSPNASFFFFSILEHFVYIHCVQYFLQDGSHCLFRGPGCLRLWANVFSDVDRWMTF